MVLPPGRLPPSVGTYITPPRQRMPCAPRAASRLSARSFIPWPACARMCWNRTDVPSARRRAARALLLRSTSALFLRDAHIRQSWCRSFVMTAAR